ncbi:MAG: aldo/keto reductase [Lactobacillaceae bacterium]|jgi:diketogulonate reductase-like aldo/keto reductase|nr:aldo/keto reductase [Lactobacillaceae bacterium]
MEFPKIGFGTWTLGGRREPNPNNDDAADISAIKTAVKMGLRHIDTAALYAGGKTEELVGAAAKDFRRVDLFVASKVLSSRMRYDEVLQECENSLKRLNMDYLDLYYIHFPSSEIPHEETARAFNRLRAEGLVKNFGICNAKIETIESYQRHLDAPFFASQNHFNLIAREPQKTKLVDYCLENKIHFIAWRPIQTDLPERNIKSLASRGAYPLLDEMADKYGKTNAQIAVRWLTRQENVSIIFKSGKPEHIREIIDAQDFKLLPEDWKSLSDNFPRQEAVGFDSRGPLPLG